LLRFAVIGDISHAAHYVIANWPAEVTKPAFDTKGKPMSLTFTVNKQTVKVFQETLAKAAQLDGSLSKSARAFRMLLATKLSGRVIPDVGPAAPTGDSQAAG